MECSILPFTKAQFEHQCNIEGELTYNRIKEMEEENKIHGKVKFFNKEKGYGFVKSGVDEYFFHKSKCLSDNIENDSPVSFEITFTARGTQAINIKLL
jgi:CspA family cold shock protein